jgi:hypothetical protein
MIQGLIVPGPFALVASLARLEGVSKTNLLEPLKVAAGGKNERRSRFRYFSAAVVTMMVMALMASALPAVRAASGDPIEALR